MGTEVKIAFQGMGSVLFETLAIKGKKKVFYKLKLVISLKDYGK